MYFRLQYDVLDDHAYTGPVIMTQVIMTQVIMTQVIIMAYTGEMSGSLQIQDKRGYYKIYSKIKGGTLRA